MKVKLLIAFCFLIFMISFNAKAQTKQETIDWIVSKLKSYSGSGIFSVSKNDKNQIIGYGYIFFAGKAENRENVYHLIMSEKVNGNDGLKYTIDFDKVSNITSSLSVDNVTENVFINGTAGFIETVEYSNRIEDKSSRESLLSIALLFKYGADYSNVVAGLINLDSEPNLKERMIKAFKRLAELNNAAKPKETF